MVSKASDDLPDPETPVTTVRVLWGISKSMFFRLWTRAPRTTIVSDIGEPPPEASCALRTAALWLQIASGALRNLSIINARSGYVQDGLACMGCRSSTCNCLFGDFDYLSMGAIAAAGVQGAEADQTDHHSYRRDQQNGDGAAECLLAFCAGAQGRAVAHGAALSEGRRRPQGESESDRGKTQLHFTPR